MRGARWSTVLLVFAVAACTSPPATMDPAGSDPPDFALDVLPAEEPTASRMAIPGSKYCFLVLVDRQATTGGPVTIGATATNATVVDIRPVELEPGVVGEVWVVADAATTETEGTLTVTGSRAGVDRSVSRTIPVFPMADERAADARPYADRWLRWLATEHPELGIRPDGTWEPIFVSTLLVVSHYSYWSDDWELTLAWHNMIAPHDWSDIYLRRRGTDALPSLAFRIDSVSGETEPHAIDPPTELVR